MRLASQILGIISSILGLLFGIFFVIGTSALTSLARNYEVASNIDVPMANLHAWFTVGCFIVGLVSSCLVMANPRPAGNAMLAVSIIGLLFIFNTVYTQIMSVLLLIAGIFALIGAKEINIPSDEKGPKESSIENGNLLKAWWKAGRTKTIEEEVVGDEKEK